MKKFLLQQTTRTNAEFGMIKICIASIYLMAGAYFQHFFIKDLYVLGVIFIVTAVWLGLLWFKKMNAK